MELRLYTTQDKNNTINKTLTNEHNINISLKKSESKESPSIILTKLNYNDENYAFIPFFKRYYFIEDVNVVNNNLLSLQLTTDVLESYKEDILNSNAVLKESNELDYTSDGPVDSRKDIEKFESNVNLDENVKTKIMVTTGSGS